MLVYIRRLNARFLHHKLNVDYHLLYVVVALGKPSLVMESEKLAHNYSAGNLPGGWTKVMGQCTSVIVMFKFMVYTIWIFYTALITEIKHSLNWIYIYVYMLAYLLLLVQTLTYEKWNNLMWCLNSRNDLYLRCLLWLEATINPTLIFI